jgi:hypothetical protein
VPRILFILLLSAICIIAGHAVAADKPGNNLIPVRPSYEEAVAEPSSQADENDVYPRPATPAEQLYVFWFLGKVLSYPVDTLEAYISKVRADWQSKPEPTAVPAAAAVGPNPFDTRRLGQIPPAPPVRSGPADRP